MRTRQLGGTTKTPQTHIVCQNALGRRTTPGQRQQNWIYSVWARPDRSAFTESTYWAVQVGYHRFNGSSGCSLGLLGHETLLIVNGSRVSVTVLLHAGDASLFQLDKRQKPSLRASPLRGQLAEEWEKSRRRYKQESRRNHGDARASRCRWGRKRRRKWKVAIPAALTVLDFKN